MRKIDILGTLVGASELVQEACFDFNDHEHVENGAYLLLKIQEVHAALLNVIDVASKMELPTTNNIHDERYDDVHGLYDH